MGFSSAYCGKVKGYQTRTASGYETSSALSFYKYPCSLYSLYVRIAVGVAVITDLRVFVWDFVPPGVGVAPVLGVDKLVMMSVTLIASDMWFWEPPDEGWKNTVQNGCVETLRLGYPFDYGVYVQLVDNQPGTPIAGADLMFVSSRYLTE